MRFRSERVVQHEILEEQTPEVAAHSLKDLVRINRYLGGHKVLLSLLERAGTGSGAFSFLDIGAGSGDAAEVLRREFPRAFAVCVDYKLHHLAGARAASVVADVHALPFRPRSFDVVYCSLFLHHFSNDDAARILRAMGGLARKAVLVNDLERHLLPFVFLPATAWAFAWHPVTLHDGPISVQAGFTREELAALARRAGLRDIDVRRHRPSFRLSMAARPPGVTLAV
jgi:SAM-dependent methyltransferase